MPREVVPERTLEELREEERRLTNLIDEKKLELKGFSARQKIQEAAYLELAELYMNLAEVYEDMAALYTTLGDIEGVQEMARLAAFYREESEDVEIIRNAAINNDQSALRGVHIRTRNTLNGLYADRDALSAQRDDEPLQGGFPGAVDEA